MFSRTGVGNVLRQKTTAGTVQYKLEVTVIDAEWETLPAQRFSVSWKRLL